MRDSWDGHQCRALGRRKGAKPREGAYGRVHCDVGPAAGRPGRLSLWPAELGSLVGGTVECTQVARLRAHATWAMHSGRASEAVNRGTVAPRQARPAEPLASRAWLTCRRRCGIVRRRCDDDDGRQGCLAPGRPGRLGLWRSRVWLTCWRHCGNFTSKRACSFPFFLIIHADGAATRNDGEALQRPFD